MKAETKAARREQIDTRNDQPNVGDDKLLQQLHAVHGGSSAYESAFTHDEWQRLSLKFKRQWWTETNYGKRAASPELIALGRQELERQEHQP